MNQPPQSHDRRPSPNRGKGGYEQQDHGDGTAMPPGYLIDDRGIDFSRAVPDNGYLWWYVDAVSNDGQQAMTLIVFVGSVFSPYYARARRKGNTNAERHCAFNTILYGPGGRKRWSMTERSSRSLRRERDHFALGPSELSWDGSTLEARIDEWCVPTPRRMRGTIRLRPRCVTSHSLMLDHNGHHRWNPLSPMAEVELDFPSLNTTWSGSGYLDSNMGSEPLAHGFSGWDWLRLHTDEGDCRVRYEAREPDRQPHRLALRFTPDGQIITEAPGPSRTLPSTPIWRIERRLPQGSTGAITEEASEELSTNAERGTANTVELVKTLEDTPFYARSMIRDTASVTGSIGVHESLSMTRFDAPWVQRLLPFRMPRIG